DPQHNLWRVTKFIRQPLKRIPPVQRTDGSWCRLEMYRANAFAEHLEGVFTPFDRCLPEDAAETARLLAKPSRDAGPIPPVTEEETAELITIMSNNKAPGDDGINAIALKMLPPPSIQLITRIYNRCLEIGYFPSTWKRAQVTMIPKPGKPEANLSEAHAGVPQGGVLGPLMYNAYTADLPVLQRPDLLAATYADDTAFLTTADSALEAADTMQLQLDLLSDWQKRWNIAVNNEKSTASTFS
ncbi:hypothetical protein KR026_006895, partial [Drosophila bipectinata]